MAETVKKDPKLEESLGALYETQDSNLADEYDRPVETRRQAPEEEPEPEESPEEEPEPEPQPEAPKHSAYTLRLAHDLGVAQEEIDAATPAELDRKVYLLNRQVLLAQREAGRAEAAQQALERRRPEPKPEEPEDDFDIGLDKEKWEPAFVDGLKGGLRKQFDLQARQIKELREELAQIKKRDDEREARSATQRYDACFARRPDLFGKGPMASLKKDSRDAQTRLAVWSVMKNLQGGDIEDRYEEAMKILRYDLIKAPGADEPEESEEPDEPAPPRPRRPAAQVPQTARPAPRPAARPAQKPKKPPTEAEWEEGAVARPTQREGAAEPRGEAKALRAAASYMRDHGLGDDDDMTEEGFLE